MKKMLKLFVFVLTLVIVFNGTVYAKDQIKFIYIHGTNDNNYEKKLEFKRNVDKIHPYIVKRFNDSTIAKAHLTHNGKYTLSQQPIAFYWGDQSKADLNVMADWLDVSKFFSTKMAQTVRTTLAYTLHDAIWIQKYNHMHPVLDKLHAITNVISSKGDKYVIFGHSAGSFIAYEYMLYKLPIIDTSFLAEVKNIDNVTKKKIKDIGYRETCIDAMIDSNVAVYKKDNTFYIDNKNLVENYKKLPAIEKKVCVYPENFAGIVTFGSPISLFYSGFMNDTEYNMSILGNYLITHNMFWLNVNFSEDPLGFPIINDNLASSIAYDSSYSENDSSATKVYNRGFIYDKSNCRVNKFLTKAHTVYWHKTKFFPKSLVNAYEAGVKAYEDAIIIKPTKH